MEKTNGLLVVCLSFLLYQCDTNNGPLVNQTNKEMNEEVAVATGDFTIITENKQAREEAEKIVFSSFDYLKTKQVMSDDAIAPFDYKTGLVGDKAYNIKVYVTALERVKRNLSVKDNQLIIKAKSGAELNMSEDLFSYISQLMRTWNDLIKKGQFSILKVGEGYYDIEPDIEFMKSVKANPVDISSIKP